MQREKHGTMPGVKLWGSWSVAPMLHRRQRRKRWLRHADEMRLRGCRIKHRFYGSNFNDVYVQP